MSSLNPHSHVTNKLIATNSGVFLPKKYGKIHGKYQPPLEKTSNTHP